MKLRDTLLSALLAGLLTLVPATAHAGRLDTKAAAEIDKLLKLVSNGDTVGQYRHGELAAGGVFRFQIAGDEKFKYYFNAICDDDCTNLDLFAFDADGKELDTDDADDPFPSLEIQSIYDSSDKPRPRQITVEVRMVACKAEACAWGARVGAYED
jgi:hypothetical protein